MKKIILSTIILTSLYSKDFISIKSDSFFIKNRIDLVNNFVTEMQLEHNSSAIISKVNSFCNEFPYISDQKLYGKSDYWASPEEFVTNGGGDCEDYVVIKYEILKYLGIKDMFYGTKVKDGVLHAILLIKQDNGVIITLDNINNNVYSENVKLLKIFDINKMVTKKLNKV